MDIKKMMKDAGVEDMFKQLQTAQSKGEPRASFPKDEYSTLKSNIISHDKKVTGSVLSLRDGTTKDLSYTWQEVENILNK